MKTTRNTPHKKFTEEDDEKLKALVKEHGKKWKEVSIYMQTFNERQCKDRYEMYLDPDINHMEFTYEEDKLLLELANKMERKWSEIKIYFNNRTPYMLKNRWDMLIRKQKRVERKVKSTKKPRNTKEEKIECIEFESVTEDLNLETEPFYYFSE